MKKKILCLAMTLILVLGMPLTVHAEDYEGADNWSVTFNGKKMKSNFTTAELSEEILNLQPGDSITIQIKLKNTAVPRTDWYMTNEVLETLEESNNSAEGGAYTYILTYKDPQGKVTTLYSSEVVGGEETPEAIANEGEGLHQATNSLEKYFFLDRIANGEKGYITLYVKLDGETQGNDYQDTLARLKMNFAVEMLDEGTYLTHTTTQGETRVVRVVKTGDNSQLVLFSTLALVSGLAILAIAVKSMKRREEKGEQQ